MNIKPLKIAFIVDRFGQRYGGAEAYGVALMRELSRDHKITVFAREYDDECGLDLEFIPLKNVRWWPGWYRVVRNAFYAAKLTRDGFDIIHSHNNGWAGHIEVIHVVPVRYKWRIVKRPTWKHWLDYISPRVIAYLWLERKRVKNKKGRYVVAVSKLIQDQLEQSYTLNQRPTIIPPGVYLPSYKGTRKWHDKRNLRRQDLGFNSTDFVVIMVARNPLRKGLEVAMQAFSSLPSHFNLLVVGCDSETKLRLLEMPLFKSLRNRITLEGVTSDVASFYICADACIHPTKNDSFGMAPLEAMSYGLPVVISPSPWCGFAAQLNHKKNAWILKNPNDAEGVVEALTSMHSNPELYKQLAENGMYVAREHDWSRIAMQYYQLYQSSISQRMA